MKLPAPLLRLAWFLALAAAPLLRGAPVDDVRAADDERVAAIRAADAVRLDAIFSDDLSYTHSNGKHDTKQSYMQALVSHQLTYNTYDYQTRSFRLASPEIALMEARVLITSVADGKPVSNDLSVLAVFRREAGKWRFLAWQSAKMPPPAGK